VGEQGGYIGSFFTVERLLPKNCDNHGYDSSDQMETSTASRHSG